MAGFSRGIPVLASDVEPCREMVTGGGNGFLIRYPHEWLQRMSELAAGDTRREKMGAAARESARAWTIERGWHRWADACTGPFRSQHAVPGRHCPGMLQLRHGVIHQVGAA